MKMLALCARRAVWRSALRWLLLLFVFGCEAETEWLDATQVLVTVQSDLADELVSVHVQVYDAEGTTLGQEHTFQLSPQLRLPLTFTVVPPAGSMRKSFRVLVRGTDGNGSIVESKAVSSFAAERTTRLELWLWAGCRGARCSASQTCEVVGTTPMCRDIPRIAPDPVLFDAGTSEDAASMATRDAGAAIEAGGADATGPTVVAPGAPNDGGSADSSVARTDSAIGSAVDSAVRETGAGQPAEASAPTDANPDAPETAPIPKDGDPSKPLLAAVSGMPCKTAAGLDATEMYASAAINDIEFFLDYPCGKHEGAQMTFILNLHGTVSSDDQKLYLRDYFAARRQAIDDNLIVLTPKAVGAQWGNGDGGKDQANLLTLVNWVYWQFEKANIRSMWIAAHSWASTYTLAGAQPLACVAGISNRLTGVISMAGARPSTACPVSYSIITTLGTKDTLTAVDLSPFATQHGCTTPASGPELVGNNERRYFANCNSGFAYEDYRMTGKGHADPLDAVVVDKIVSTIKSLEN